MGSKRNIAVFVLLALVALLAALLRARVPDPAWLGKPLHQWLADCYTNIYPVGFEPIAAVRAMGTNTLPRLRRELRIRDFAVTLNAIEFLRKNKICRIAHVPATTRRRIAANLCEALGPRAAPALPELTALADETDVSLRVAAIRALGAIGAPALDPLTHLAQDPQPLIRCSTLTALGELGPPAWTTLSNSLSDQSPLVRYTAARGLTKAGPEAAIRCLKDPDPMVRRGGASLLSNLRTRDPSAERALVNALRDSDLQVRLEAAEVLRQIDPGWSDDALRQIISEATQIVLNPTARRDVRQNMARLLPSLDPKALNSVPFLRDALMSNNQQLLALRVEALYLTNGPSRMGDLIKLLAYQPDYNVRIAAAETLGRLGPDAGPALSALQGALEDQWPFVRASATKAVARIGTPKTQIVPLLEQQLHDSSLQVQVEAAAGMWSLGQADADQLRPLLQEALNHKLSRVRARAAEILEQMARGPSVPEPPP
jgi:HEAT repeat protein